MVNILTKQLTFDEFSNIVNKLICYKAPSTNSVLINLLKVLNTDNRLVLCKFIKGWIELEETIYKE